MKKSPVLTSAAGVAAVFCAFVAVNYLVDRVPKRIDLTQEKAYTLSDGTRSILARLDAPVQVRFYCTRNETMPPQLKLYARQVEDLLEEYRQASHGMLEIQKLDPEPDSDAEDSAKLDGVEGEVLSDGERLYLGLSVSQLDQKEVVAFLSPDRERLLEYDLSRAIGRVTQPEKPVLGVMSPLPVAGQAANPMLMQMGQANGRPPWTLYRELKRDFRVEEVSTLADAIPEEIKVLLVIHPRNIRPETQYALDQFVLRGGKLIAFLDPMAALDRQAGGMMGRSASSSNLDKLLAAWGIEFDSGKVVADAEFIGQNGTRRTPGILSLGEQALSHDDILTAAADNLFLVYPGSFSGTPAEGLKETVLLHSSRNAQLVDPVALQMSPQDALHALHPDGKEHALAIRLTGKFKTAFPDGKPEEKKENENKDAGEKKETAKKEQTPPAPKPASLAASREESTVILIGDSDMIQDPAMLIEQQNPLTGARMLLPANGNLAFAQAAVEQMSGDNDLIAVRSRASRERPFTLVRKMQAQAGAVYQSKIGELEASLSETQRKLAAMQQTQEGAGQQIILSPGQQQEIVRFRKTEATVRKQLKEVRRNLRAKTDALETRIKWINIAAMPLAVTLYGLGLGLYQRKRTSAK